ncbi:hypothetical protein [Agromyces bauzanensis]|uniref:Uncharacterized protein n=1 Tax=Agromyces bauzanensis TaxID=1308924 RepID=A0A917PP60_9MICO|nr:hypothetical protein [Agromyces bauzanensis]GGJ86653.1 hypothetical protein GCM10011372_26340 [Agromyces bauzanensis]
MLGPIGASAVDNDNVLDVCTAEVSAGEAADLAASGFDVSDSGYTESGVSVDVVLTDEEAKSLRDRGVDVKVKSTRTASPLGNWLRSRRSRATRCGARGTRPAASPDELHQLAKDNRRSLGEVTLKYSVHGADPASASTEEWTGGDRYGGQTGVHYAIMSGFVTGTSLGDSVEVRFEGGGEGGERGVPRRPGRAGPVPCSRRIG